MAAARANTLKRMLLGFIAAVAFTILAIVIFSLLMIAADIGDKAIRTINQIIKVAAIVLGTIIAVPRSGEKGLVSGVVIALFYTIAGYICYLSLGGAEFSFASMMGELLIGMAAGAVCGAVRANLPPKHKKRHKIKV